LRQITHAALSHSDQSPHIKSLAYALAIFSHLSCPRSVLSPSGLGAMAQAMRQAMDQPGIRLCASTHWTIWQFMLGYMTAVESETKDWFSKALRGVCTVMYTQSWNAFDTVLSMTLRPTSQLLGKFRDVWSELQ
jgi:hypothetical protein